MNPNVDNRVVNDFGDEWNRFDQSRLSSDESREVFHAYFSIFPWEKLPQDAVGFDLGCGSGRWAKWVAPRAGTLHCIDPSDAIEVAKRNLSDHENCVFHKAGVDNIPLPDSSADFCYSLGVLHHVPDTAAGIEACVRKLKPGAPFLVYLYYAFDNRPQWFRLLWKLSDAGRRILSNAPQGVKHICCDLISIFVYWPLARMARLLEKTGLNVENFPLSCYRHRSYYVMRTDALDRFGTRLEKRFTREQIKKMMEAAGLRDILFSDNFPYWVAIGFRK